MGVTASEAADMSNKLGGWLLPMFNIKALRQKYCEQFGNEVPNCGQLPKGGCGISDNCNNKAQNCVEIDEDPGYKCVGI